MLKSWYVGGAVVFASLAINLSAGADTGKYLAAGPGAQLESCLQGKIRKDRATIEDLRLGETWACVTLSYFWDENDHVTRFVENYNRGTYRFERSSLEHGSESLLYPRNVIDPAHPVDFTVYSTNEQTGVREDIRVGLEHTVDFIVADSSEFLLVERSLRNSSENLRARPSLGESPLAWLDFPAAREFEQRTGESHPELYRRVTQYLGCYRLEHPEAKAQVPCFGDLDRQ